MEVILLNSDAFEQLKAEFKGCVKQALK